MRPTNEHRRVHARPAVAANLLLTSDSSYAARQRLALPDFDGGLRMWRLAWTFGWFDIRLRYRGSVLGPFWLTLSTAVMVGALVDEIWRSRPSGIVPAR